MEKGEANALVTLLALAAGAAVGGVLWYLSGLPGTYAGFGPDWLAPWWWAWGVGIAAVILLVGWLGIFMARARARRS